MDFYSHTQHWIKGELFESVVILAFAVMLLIIAVALWKFGTTAGAKALILPLILISAVYLGVGASLQTSNQARLQNFPTQYQQNPTAFIHAEKKRVEDFQYQYKISKAVATVCFAIALVIFWLGLAPVWQGVALGLAFFGLTGLVVDYFSQERSQIYYQAIVSALS